MVAERQHHCRHFVVRPTDGRRGDAFPAGLRRAVRVPVVAPSGRGLYLLDRPRRYTGVSLQQQGEGSLWKSPFCIHVSTSQAVECGQRRLTSALSLTGKQQEKMDKGNVNTWDGVLVHLEMLEVQAHEAAMKQQEKELQEEKLARLKAKVKELRLQRDELRAKVDLQEKKQLEKEGATSDPVQASPKTVLQWKIKSLQAMLQVFHLTGISAKLTRQGVCFCISTAYEGIYLDSYNLDLLTKSEVQIYHHSVPPFIPLEQITKQYLQTDIRRFLSVLSDHLNAYVGRRYQADQLQKHFSDQIEGTLQRNSLCNLLVFNYNVSSKSKTFPFNVRLLYGDLCRSLPTEVIVSCTPDAPVSLTETATAHSDLFRHMPLHKAFHSFNSAEETLDGTP